MRCLRKPFPNTAWCGVLFGGQTGRSKAQREKGPGGRSDGGVFTFGDAAFYGSLRAHPPASPEATMAASVDGQGSYMTGIDGAVCPFGDAPYLAPAHRQLGGVVKDETEGQPVAAADH
jgi:hypothetical protein